MEPIRENGHVYLRPSEPPHKTHLGVWVGTGLAILVVAVGWLFTVGSTIQGAVEGVKTSASDAGSVFTEIKDNTADSRSDVADTGEQIKAIIAPYVRVAHTEEQAMDVVAGIVKANLEADPAAAATADTTTTTPETYGQQEQPTTTE